MQYNKRWNNIYEIKYKYNKRWNLTVHWKLEEYRGIVLSKLNQEEKKYWVFSHVCGKEAKQRSYAVSNHDKL